MRRKSRSRSRSVSGGGSINSWGGSLLIITGCVSLLVSIIMFVVSIGQLDTAITTAGGYTEMTGLTDIMGIWGLVLFLAFMAIGIGALGAGAYLNIRGKMSGNWMDLLMLAVIGGVTIVIALIMNGIAIGQLHTAWYTVNQSTNVADFAGLQEIIGVFGMVLFLSLMAAGLAQIGGAGYGGYKKIRGAF